MKERYVVAIFAAFFVGSLVFVYRFSTTGPVPVSEQVMKTSVGIRPVPDESALRAQVEVYYKAWQRQDAKAMFELFDRYAQEVGPRRPFFGSDSKKQFEASSLVSYEIQRIEIQSDRGIDWGMVEARLTLQSGKGKKPVEETDFTLWLRGKFEERWYYNGQKPPQPQPQPQRK